MACVFQKASRFVQKAVPFERKEPGFERKAVPFADAPVNYLETLAKQQRKKADSFD
jgi:hypothetical protein